LAIGVYFHGRQLVKPQAATHVDAEEMTRSQIGAIGTIGIIGEAAGGEPGIVQSFLNPVTARNVLKDGDLLTGLEICYNPSSDVDKFPGAYRTKAIRVNPATKATGKILDVGSADWINLQSNDWGSRQTQIRFKITQGTVKTENEGVDGFLLTIEDTLEDIVEIGDNLGPTFKVRYLGNASTAQLTITSSQVSIVLAGDQTDGSEDLVIDTTKSSYNTVLEIVNHINTFNPFYEAVVLGDNNLDTTELDAVTSQDVKANYYVCVAYKETFLNFMNTIGDLVTGTFVGSANQQPQIIGWTFLSGGSEGSVIPQDWQDALDLFQSESVDIVLVMTEDEAIHQLLSAHNNYMSANGRKERTSPIGHPLAEEANPNLILARARNLNSSRVVLCTPGINRYNRLGQLEQLSSAYTACAYAGMAASADLQEPLTYDYINAVGLTTQYSDEQMDEFLLGGVSPVESVENQGYRIVQSITTYLKSDNTLYREWNVQRIADSISKNMREELEASFIGTGGTLDKPSQMKRTVERILKDMIADGRIVSYKPPNVVLEQGVARIDYEVSPTEPINYILITTHFKSARLTA